jgi:hypothetical protein
VSLWHCPQHGLTGPTPCCSASSLARIDVHANVSEKWDLLTKPTPDSMRGRMLADEALSEEEFERQAHRIALEAHEDRLKLWETALERWERLQRYEADGEAK